MAQPGSRTGARKRRPDLGCALLEAINPFHGSAEITTKPDLLQADGIRVINEGHLQPVAASYHRRRRDHDGGIALRERKLQSIKNLMEARVGIERESFTTPSLTHSVSRPILPFIHWGSSKFHTRSFIASHRPADAPELLAR